MHRLSWKMAAGTEGMAAVNLAMDSKFGRSRCDIITEIMDEFGEGFELAAGRSGLLEVADHTNANSGLVDILTSDMAAMELLQPARPNFDLAVTRIDAVADDEMVGEPMNHAHALAMKTVVDFCVAAMDGAVMSHHVFPTGTFQADLACGSDHVADVAIGHGGTGPARNEKLLSHENSVAAQAVGLADGGHAHTVVAGNQAERFASNHDMNEGFARSGWHHEGLPGQNSIAAKVVGSPEFGKGDSSITRDGSEGVTAFDRVRRKAIVGSQWRTAEKQAGPSEEAQPEKITPIPNDHKNSQSTERPAMQPFPGDFQARQICLW
jgi:hypothetical protein